MGLGSPFERTFASRASVALCDVTTVGLARLVAAGLARRALDAEGSIARFYGGRQDRTCPFSHGWVRPNPCKTAVGRRAKRYVWREATSLLSEQERPLFGEDFAAPDHAAWLAWLRGHPEARQAFDRIVRAGCDRDGLTTLLIDLHISRHWHRCARRDLERAQLALVEAGRWVTWLGQSTLQFDLELSERRNGRRPHWKQLRARLGDLRDRIGVHLPVASKKRQHLRDALFADLLRFLMDSTGRLHLEEVQDLLWVLWPPNGFDPYVWLKKRRAVIRTGAEARRVAKIGRAHV